MDIRKHLVPIVGIASGVIATPFLFWGALALFLHFRDPCEKLADWCKVNTPDNCGGRMPDEMDGLCRKLGLDKNGCREACQLALTKAQDSATMVRDSRKTAADFGHLLALNAPIDAPVMFRAGGVEWKTEPAKDRMTWKDAKSYCSRLAVDGGPGWKLPTKDELFALYYDKASRENVRSFDWSGPAYWTSTPGSPGTALTVEDYFGTPMSTTAKESDNRSVRCVR